MAASQEVSLDLFQPKLIPFSKAFQTSRLGDFINGHGDQSPFGFDLKPPGAEAVLRMSLFVDPRLAFLRDPNIQFQNPLIEFALAAIPSTDREVEIFLRAVEPGPSGRGDRSSNKLRSL
jgi:hypothetical protein